MNLTEKISYIRGLCDGLELDESKPEVKVLNAIVDLLDDMAFEVSDMEELYDELSAQVDEIDQDLADVESDVYDDEDYDIEDYDDEDDDYDFDDEENPFYEVTCDSCGQKLNVSEDEKRHWKGIVDNMYLPYDKERDIFPENDGFMDKDLTPVSEIE